MTALAPCCVCGGAASLLSSALGPVALAYCAECYECGAEPYGMAVFGHALQCAGAPDETTMATVLRAGKTAEQWWTDVAATRADIAADPRINGEVT